MSYYDEEPEEVDFPEDVDPIQSALVKAMTKTIEGKISDEQISAALAVAIQEQVKHVCDYTIEKSVRDIAENYLTGEMTSKIKEVTAEALKKPVREDNGWGKHYEADTFEDYIRQKVKDKVKDDYYFRDAANDVANDAVRQLKNEIQAIALAGAKDALDKAIKK